MEQIEVVRHVLASSKQRGKVKSKSGGGGGEQVRPHSSTQVHIPQDGEVEIVTTVKSKPRQKSGRDQYLSSDSRSSSQESLQMLRKMKQIQQTLQRDDLSWK